MHSVSNSMHNAHALIFISSSIVCSVFVLCSILSASVWCPLLFQITWPFIRPSAWRGSKKQRGKEKTRLLIVRFSFSSGHMKIWAAIATPKSCRFPVQNPTFSQTLSAIPQIAGSNRPLTPSIPQWTRSQNQASNML
jgi:hypothetical protein